MYCCADKPTIVLVDPCPTPSKDRSQLPLLGEISCLCEDWCFYNLRNTFGTFETMHRCCLGYSGLYSKTYLFDCFTGVRLTIFLVLWFIQVALLGSVAAMARWLGTELLELTATDNGRGPSWKTLVIPLSFQAFSPSLVTFGLAFANPSPQPFADPQVLASSWTTCRETAILCKSRLRRLIQFPSHLERFLVVMKDVKENEACEHDYAWLHFDTVTLLHGFRLSLGFKEHLSCIDVLPAGIHTAEEFPGFFVGWGPAPQGQTAYPPRAKSLPTCTAQRSAASGGYYWWFLHAFVRPFKHFWSLFLASLGFIGCISCFCEAWREQLPPDSNLSMLAMLCDSWDFVSNQGRKGIE